MTLYGKSWLVSCKKSSWKIKSVVSSSTSWTLNYDWNSLMLSKTCKIQSLWLLFSGTSWKMPFRAASLAGWERDRLLPVEFSTNAWDLFLLQKKFVQFKLYAFSTRKRCSSNISFFRCSLDSSTACLDSSATCLKRTVKVLYNTIVPVWIAQNKISTMQ